MYFRPHTSAAARREHDQQYSILFSISHHPACHRSPSFRFGTAFRSQPCRVPCKELVERRRRRSSPHYLCREHGRRVIESDLTLRAQASFIAARRAVFEATPPAIANLYMPRVLGRLHGIFHEHLNHGLLEGSRNVRRTRSFLALHPASVDIIKQQPISASLKLKSYSAPSIWAFGNFTASGLPSFASPVDLRSPRVSQPDRAGHLVVCLPGRVIPGYVPGSRISRIPGHRPDACVRRMPQGTETAVPDPGCSI